MTIIIIGLDGASFKLIKELIKKDSLPNIKRLINEGVSCRLKTTVPPSSAVSWSSMATGVNPGKHNIFSFFKYKEYKRYPISSRDRKFITLWHTLSKERKRVGIINFPVSFPPDRVRGFMISGMLTPGLHSNFTFPPQLKYELIKLNYKIDVDFSLIFNKKLYIKKCIELAELRKNIGIRLMKRYQLDLFIIIFTFLDRIQHHYWVYMNPEDPEYNVEEAKEYGTKIFESYMKADEIIGDFIKYAENMGATIIVVSDHGFTPIYKSVFINTLLVKMGLLKMKETYYEKKLLCSLKSKFEYFSKKLAKYSLIIPSKLKRKIEKIITPLIFPELENIINWSKSKAFYFHGYGIRINLKGRDPLGNVSPGAEYDRICDEIITELYALKDPDTDKKVIDKVYRNYELYFGKYINNGPDLVVMPRDTYTLQEILSDEVVTPYRGFSNVSAEHTNETARCDAILLASGDTIKCNKFLENATILDITPTLLYLMNSHPPKGIDGRVLIEALDI